MKEENKIVEYRSPNKILVTVAIIISILISISYFLPIIRIENEYHGTLQYNAFNATSITGFLPLLLISLILYVVQIIFSFIYLFKKPIKKEHYISYNVLFVVALIL